MASSRSGSAAGSGSGSGVGSATSTVGGVGLARGRGEVGPGLLRAFQGSFRAGKRVRTRAGYGHRAGSKRAVVTVAEGDRIDIFGGPVS